MGSFKFMVGNGYYDKVSDAVLKQAAERKAMRWFNPRRYGWAMEDNSMWVGVICFVLSMGSYESYGSGERTWWVWLIMSGWFWVWRAWVIKKSWITHAQGWKWDIETMEEAWEQREQWIRDQCIQENEQKSATWEEPTVTDISFNESTPT